MTIGFPGTSQATRLAVLQVDGRKFLLPQDEIDLLEPLLEIDTKDRLPGSMGWLQAAGRKWPLYCLNDKFEMLDHIPETRRAGVLLHDGEHYLGIVCDQISMLDEHRLERHSLPTCMQLPDNPIQSLVIYQGYVECVTTTGRLASLFNPGVDQETERRG